MSHLGDRLSALVDGELSAAERDRAHAHLASCEQCRAEAAELRALKRKLRGLTSGAPAEAAMTRRLIAMTGPGGPLPPRQPAAPRAVRPARGPARIARAGYRRATRRRYLVLGAVSVVVGLGAAAFTAGGGGQARTGPADHAAGRDVQRRARHHHGRGPVHRPVSSVVSGSIHG